MRGSGLFPRNDADDRPEAVFGGTNTIHTGGPHTSHILLPRIPA